MLIRLKDLREDNDFLQKDLAEYLHCRQQTYSRYETGVVEPPIEVLIKLAQFYHVTVDYLIGFSDSPNGINQ